jgi:protein SCO1
MAAPGPSRRIVHSLVGVGVFALLLAGVSAFQIWRLDASSFHGTAYPDSPIAPDFQLVGHSGDSLSLTAFTGSPVLLFFGFTNCPDACPMTLSRVTNALESTGIEEARVLLVTVDPENDTPERLAEYAAAFGPQVIGLTGDPSELTRVLAAYGAYAEPGSEHDGSHTIIHSTIVFGIDRTGRLRVLMHADEGPDAIEHDIRVLSRIRA